MVGGSRGVCMGRVWWAGVGVCAKACVGRVRGCVWGVCRASVDPCVGCVRGRVWGCGIRHVRGLCII